MPVCEVRRGVGAGRRTSGRCGGSGRRGLAASAERIQKSAQLRAYRFVVLAAQTVAQLYRHVEWPEGRGVGPEDFSDEALGSITIDRPRGGFAPRDHPQSGAIARVANRSRDEAATGDAYIGAENGLELDGPSQYSSPCRGSQARAALSAAAFTRGLVFRRRAVRGPWRGVR